MLFHTRQLRAIQNDPDPRRWWALNEEVELWISKALNAQDPWSETTVGPYPIILLPGVADNKQLVAAALYTTLGETGKRATLEDENDAKWGRRGLHKEWEEFQQLWCQYDLGLVIVPATGSWDVASVEDEDLNVEWSSSVLEAANRFDPTELRHLQLQNRWPRFHWDTDRVEPMPSTSLYEGNFATWKQDMHAILDEHSHGLSAHMDQPMPHHCQFFDELIQKWESDDLWAAGIVLEHVWPLFLRRVSKDYPPTTHELVHHLGTACQTFPLLNLPRELRDGVYGLAFSQQFRFVRNLSLLLVSREVGYEAGIINDELNRA